MAMKIVVTVLVFLIIQTECALSDILETKEHWDNEYEGKLMCVLNTGNVYVPLFIAH